MSVAHEYVNAIMRRRQEPMEPLGFEPDWADRPHRYKVYADVPRLSLPFVSDRTVGTVDAALAPPPSGPGARLDLTGVARLLHDAYGLGSRRLALNANSDVRVAPLYRDAAWSRGTASGGGLYPLEIYWACGPGGPLLPGVYHYQAGLHALQRLLVGDVTPAVRAALGNADAGTQFLLVTVKFWKNAFKYNSFCYHAVTMDVGTLLGTWQLWARAAGVALRPWLWFDEPALNDLLGLETVRESVFAVVPLPAGGSLPNGSASNARVTRAEDERSRTVIRFPQVEDVHLATVPTDGARPDPGRLAPARPASPAPPAPAAAAGTPVPLPAPTPMPVDLAHALRTRRSSFGRFSSRPALSPPDLGALLAAATSGGRLDSDVKPAGTPDLTRLVVFVNHVAGLPQGIYDYDAANAALVPVALGEVGTFLQSTYFLPNYNVEQAAAVLTVVGRPLAAMDAAGPRGYRFVNAEVGAVAQATYTACAALGVGCGAALGFDNVSYAERIGLTGTGEWPILILMVGHERRGDPAVDARIS